MAECAHEWKPAEEIRYVQAKTMAYSGCDPVPREVDVTWVYDEVCVHCGAESCWPT